MRAARLIVAMGIVGCGRTGMLFASGLGLLGCSTSAPRVHEPQLTVAQIIFRTRIDQLFTKQVDPKDVAVGPDRVFATVEGRNRRGACFRASAGTLLDSQMRRTVTYVVLIDDNRIIDRRPATREDHCDGDSYEPVTPLPALES